MQPSVRTFISMFPANCNNDRDIHQFCSGFDTSKQRSFAAWIIFLCPPTPPTTTTTIPIPSYPLGLLPYSSQ